MQLDCHDERTMSLAETHTELVTSKSDDINNNYSMVNSNLSEAMVPQARTLNDEYRREADECVLDRFAVRHALSSLAVARTSAGRNTSHNKSNNENLDEMAPSALLNGKTAGSNGVLSLITLNNSTLPVNGSNSSGGGSMLGNGPTVVSVVNLNNAKIANTVTATKKTTTTTTTLSVVPSGSVGGNSTQMTINQPIKVISGANGSGMASGTSVAPATINGAPNGLNILTLANGAVKKDLEHENSSSAIPNPNPNPSVVSLHNSYKMNGSLTGKKLCQQQPQSQQQQTQSKLYHYAQPVNSVHSAVVNSNTFNVVYKMPLAANHHHHHHNHHTDTQTSTSNIL